MFNVFIMNKKDNIWLINFNIKKFNKIDDVLSIINLVDEKMCTEEKIYGTNIVIKIKKSDDIQIDYICETNIDCFENIIIKFLDYKFTQMQNLIKYYNDNYGLDWYIDYVLVNIPKNFD